MRRKNVKVEHRTRLQQEIENERIKRDREFLSVDFGEFVKGAWHIVEPGTTYLPGYHIDAIVEHLEACSKREILKLLINICPRHTKSTLCSVLYPAWMWTKQPDETFLYASYSSRLAIGDAVKARYIIESDWFQARWPLAIKEDSNTKASYQNERMGSRQTTSVNGTVTGLGGRHLILDDPHNVQDAESSAVRDAALTWFSESWATRKNTADTVMITIMQRVHAQDISQKCIEAGWDHLLLPMEYDGRRLVTSLGWADPRTEHGEILWPARYTKEDAASLKTDMGEYAYANQFQQNPVPRGGGIIKKQWLRFWYDEELGTPEPVKHLTEEGTYLASPQRPRPTIQPDTMIQSWDLAFKGTDKSDYVVGQVWGADGSNRYLLDQDRGKNDFPKTLAAMRRVSEKWPAYLKLVEEKANGSAVIASLQDELQGILPVQPQGGKVSRATAVAPMFEAGNVYLPHPDQFPWVKDLMDELTTFPKASHDDQVDALTQALTRMQSNNVAPVDVGFMSDTGAGDMGLAIRSSPFWNVP